MGSNTRSVSGVIGQVLKAHNEGLTAQGLKEDAQLRDVSPAAMAAAIAYGVDKGEFEVDDEFRVHSVRSIDA